MAIFKVTIMYGSHIFVPSKTDNNRINKFIERVSHWVTGDYNISGITLLTSAGIIPFGYAQEIEDLKFIWKIMSAKVDINIPSALLNNINMAFKQRVPNVYIPKTICKNNYWYRVFRLLNIIPFILDEQNFAKFSQQIIGIYQHLIHNYYKDDEPCTWRLYCSCINCCNTIKTNLLTNVKDVNKLFIPKKL